jgi:molybdopterin converting factor small subunit
MARVFLTSGLHRFTGGIEELHVDGATVRELIAELDRHFPGMGEVLSTGTAVAIDGEVMNNAMYEPVSAAAEIHFLPAIRGG